MNEIEAKKIFNEAQKNFENLNYEKARELWLKILKFYPENLSLLRNISLTYFNQANFYETENILKKIIKINLKETNALNMLILVLEEQDKIEEAKQFIDIGLNNNLLNDHWKIKKELLIPMIKNDTDEIIKFRSNINKFIEEILNNQNDYNFNINDHLIKPPQFGLSYDQFDNLEINKKCVSLFRKIYPELNEIYLHKNAPSSKIKLGFISEYLTDHTIGKLFKGIILKIDKKKFEVFVFHSEQTKKGSILDELINAENKGIIKNIFLPKDFKQKQKSILDKKLDILFYPEIGLSLQLYFLSYIRLAKYQVTSWGHPETTGNDSIDYFISSKLIESENSDKNFSEKLICSESLPMFYYKPKVKNILNVEKINKMNLYSCPQTLFKLHPDFDQIIEGIQKKDKNSIFYFIKDSNKALNNIIINRLKKNLKINIDRIHFLETMNWEEYTNHCGRASVLLDPLYFGAGNSFYESMFYGTPTITMPTNYTKSRLVLGAYNQMEISDIKFNPIVNTIDDYVNSAVEIANNRNLIDIKHQLKSKAEMKLYENEKSISDLEYVLNKIVN
jgi:protein O-GlcNAc transferase